MPKPLTLQARRPFSFAETLEFAQSFPPLAAQTFVEAGTLTAALAIDGVGHAFRLSARGEDTLVLETAAPTRIHAALVRRVKAFIGADDDLEAFYARAEADPPMRSLIAAHRGLRHVRFLGGLPEIAVYCVLMQRTPVKLAARFEQKFLARFGLVAKHGDRELRAMPELPQLAALDEHAIADAIGHRTKAARIATVVREVAALGEAFLRDAPYADARDALLAIPGIGPFSAAAILLRGLGRMDELPCLDDFADHGRALYGRAWNPDAITRRYGAQIGYWSFYLKARVHIAGATLGA
jgi:DNA-3-methyladenine glycosylase II